MTVLHVPVNSGRSANDPVLNAEVESRREVLSWWININQFGSEIGVERGRRCPEFHQ